MSKWVSKLRVSSKEAQSAMGRKAQELGALQVGRLRTPGLHFVGGVAGLALQVASGGSRSWLLRVRMNGKRRTMGLGTFMPRL